MGRSDAGWAVNGWGLGWAGGGSGWGREVGTDRWAVELCWVIKSWVSEATERKTSLWTIINRRRRWGEERAGFTVAMHFVFIHLISVKWDYIIWFVFLTHFQFDVFLLRFLWFFYSILYVLCFNLIYSIDYSIQSFIWLFIRIIYHNLSLIIHTYHLS